MLKSKTDKLKFKEYHGIFMDIKERFKLFDSYLESIDGLSKSLTKPLAKLARYVFEAETGIDVTSNSDAIDVRDVIPEFDDSVETIKHFLAYGYAGEKPLDEETDEQLKHALNALRTGAMKLTNSIDVQKFNIDGAINELNSLDIDHMVANTNLAMDELKSQEQEYATKLNDIRSKMDAIKQDLGAKCASDPKYIELANAYKSVLNEINNTRSQKSLGAGSQMGNKIKNDIEYVKKCLNNVVGLQDTLSSGKGELADPNEKPSFNSYLSNEYKVRTAKADPHMMQFSDAPAQVPDETDPEHKRMKAKYAPNEVAGILPIDNFAQVVTYGLTHGLALPEGSVDRAYGMLQQIDKWIDELNNHHGSTEHELTNLDVTEAKKRLAEIPDYHAALNALEQEYQKKYTSALEHKLTESALNTLSEELGTIKKKIDSIKGIVEPIDTLKDRLDTLSKDIKDSKYKSNQLRVQLLNSEKKERERADQLSALPSHKLQVMEELNAQPYPDASSEKTFGDAIRSIQNRIKYTNNSKSNGYIDPNLDKKIAELKAFANQYFDNMIDTANQRYIDQSGDTVYQKDIGGYLYQLDKKIAMNKIDELTKTSAQKNSTSIASDFVTQLNSVVDNIINATQSDDDKKEIEAVQRALVKKNSVIQQAREKLASKLVNNKKPNKKLVELESQPLEDFMNGTRLNPSKFHQNNDGKYVYKPNGSKTLTTTDKDGKQVTTNINMASSVNLPVLVAYEMSQNAVVTGYENGTFVIQENVKRGDKTMSRWNITFTPNNEEWNVGIVADFNGHTKVDEVNTDVKDISADKLVQYGFEMLTSLFAGK